MRPERDYYEVLGVSRDADAKTIKRAFLKLARKLHPDVNDSDDAEKQFKEVNEAYSVLSDERKRANYDRFGDAEGPGGFGSDYVDLSDIFGGGFGVSDIFESFFGGSARASQAQRSAGRDMGIRLTITLEEAASGCTKTLAYDRLASCDDCAGTGVGEGGSISSCERCHGTGRVVEVQRTIFGQMQSQRSCPKCQGTGQIINHPCETCQGSGRAPSREAVELTIDKGVRSGQVIQVPNKGEAGIRGEATGSLVVSIDIAPHERFERQGDDLFCKIQIDSLEALVGTNVEIPGILENETLTIEVPPQTAYGARLELKGYGMPKFNSEGRGNVYALCEVTPPTNLSKEELKTIEDIVSKRGAR